MRLLLVAAATTTILIGTIVLGTLRVLTDTGPDW